MRHNLASIPAELFCAESYGACPSFLQGLVWEEDRAGASDALISKALDMNVAVSVVGRVSEHGLYVGADGNFINCQYGTLATAKFLKHLVKSNDTIFAADVYCPFDLPICLSVCKCEQRQYCLDDICP